MNVPLAGSTRATLVARSSHRADQGGPSRAAPTVSTRRCWSPSTSMAAPVTTPPLCGWDESRPEARGRLEHSRGIL